MYWYVRRNGKIEGPFPAGQIQQSVLLGRLDLHDQVSTDKDEWQYLQEYPELIPEVIRQKSNDPAYQDRLAAAKRWADERRFERRDGEDPSRLGPGRRDNESLSEQEYREHREQTIKSLQKRNDWSMFGIVAAVLLVVISLAVGFLLPTPEPVTADCAAQAKPGINWQHCDLNGLNASNSDLTGANISNAKLSAAQLSASLLKNSDMAYANLQQANMAGAVVTNARLTGADLRGANLTKVNFEGSDLSYVNMGNAVIDGVNFTNTRLDNAIWVDGRICKTGSISVCR